MKPLYGLLSVLGSMPEPIRFWIVFSTACTWRLPVSAVLSRQSYAAYHMAWGKDDGAMPLNSADTHISDRI